MGQCFALPHAVIKELQAHTNLAKHPGLKVWTSETRNRQNIKNIKHKSALSRAACLVIPLPAAASRLVRLPANAANELTWQTFQPKLPAWPACQWYDFAKCSYQHWNWSLPKCPPKSIATKSKVSHFTFIRGAWYPPVPDHCAKLWEMVWSYTDLDSYQITWPLEKCIIEISHPSVSIFYTQVIKENVDLLVMLMWRPTKHCQDTLVDSQVSVSPILDHLQYQYNINQDLAKSNVKSFVLLFWGQKELLVQHFTRWHKHMT